MKTLIVTFVFALCAFNVQGQQLEISGTVTDENDQLFPNAKITVKGTDNEIKTDEEGNYTINAEIGQYLVFSHAGYYNLTTLIEDDRRIDMVMERDNVHIIAAISGGFTKKEAQGYAVSTICGTDIAGSLENDFSRTLDGKMAGVIVKPQTGFVGATNTVVIRGLSSFNGTNHPLYVVDGVPYDTNINTPGNIICSDRGSNRSFDIDPNNVASVKILKGLAATNIYGSEGRNGVVLITTKIGPYANR